MATSPVDGQTTEEAVPARCEIGHPGREQAGQRISAADRLDRDQCSWPTSFATFRIAHPGENCLCRIIYILRVEEDDIANPVGQSGHEQLGRIV